MGIIHCHLFHFLHTHRIIFTFINLIFIKFWALSCASHITFFTTFAILIMNCTLWTWALSIVISFTFFTLIESFFTFIDLIFIKFWALSCTSHITFFTTFAILIMNCTVWTWALSIVISLTFF